MSNKCGMPWMKLDSKTHGTGDNHHGNNKAVMGEAHEERWSSDPDLDRSLTSQNLYYGYRSGMELYNDINKEIEALSEQLRNEGKRGVRKDAITSFAGIVKPDKELMDSMTREQQIKFFEDAMEILNEKFGSHNGKNNIRSFVVQFDEGNPHMHYFGVPYTADGRLSAKEIFTPKLNRWLNEEFPKQMNSRGWNLEPCRDENSYDPDYAKTLNEQELKEYKDQCIEYKKNRSKKHGIKAKAHKVEQDRKEGFETGFDVASDAFNGILNELVNEVVKERLTGPLNELKQLIEQETRVANGLENFALHSISSDEETELKKTLENIKFPDGRTGLDIHKSRIEKIMANRVKAGKDTSEHLKDVQSQINRLETLSETAGLTDKEQALLDRLYRDKIMSNSSELLSQRHNYSPYQQRMLDKIQREVERQERRQSRDFGMDI